MVSASLPSASDKPMRCSGEAVGGVARVLPTFTNADPGGPRSGGILPSRIVPPGSHRFKHSAVSRWCGGQWGCEIEKMPCHESLRGLYCVLKYPLEAGAWVAMGLKELALKQTRCKCTN